jgi:hypothetical protein
MTFTTDIPISGDSLGSTRDRIRGNFQETAAVMAINHVAFNTVGKGKHKFLQMPEQGSAPSVLVDEAGFYAKVATNPAEANLFFRGENNGKEYQLTSADQTNNATFGNFTAYAANQNGGWSFLPGGLVLQYGTVSGTNVVVFPKQFKNATVPVVTVTPIGTGTAGFSIHATPTHTGFTIDGNGASTFWIAIGQS